MIYNYWPYYFFAENVKYNCIFFFLLKLFYGYLIHFSCPPFDVLHSITSVVSLSLLSPSPQFFNEVFSEIMCSCFFGEDGFAGSQWLNMTPQWAKCDECDQTIDPKFILSLHYIICALNFVRWIKCERFFPGASCLTSSIPVGIFGIEVRVERTTNVRTNCHQLLMISSFTYWVYLFIEAEYRGGTKNRSQTISHIYISSTDIKLKLPFLCHNSCKATLHIARPQKIH